jgi:hypothetical protein
MDDSSGILMAIEERPTTIHAENAFAPQGPWSFLRKSFSFANRWTWILILGWELLALGTATFWARHLQNHTAISHGWSALPNHWGEQLSAQDIAELIMHGELRSPLGASASLMLLLGLVLLLWSGWRMQAEQVGLRARFGAWFGGLFDALLIGLLPLLIAASLLSWPIRSASDWGIPLLSWMNGILMPLFGLAMVSALNVQWWLCRLNRLDRREGYLRHLTQSFLRLWRHPVQWFLICFGGAVLRLTLQALVLLLAWRLGGESSGRVALFIGLQALSTAINAWILGWLLRATALYWRHDQDVRSAVQALKNPTIPSLQEEIPLEVQG